MATIRAICAIYFCCSVILGTVLPAAGQTPPETVTEPEENFVAEEAKPAPKRLNIPGKVGNSDNKLPVQYTFRWLPDQAVQQQPGEFGMWEHKLSGKAPVWIHEDGILLLSLGLQVNQVNTTVVLPDSGREIPETLWNPQLGLFYVHTLHNGWSIGGKVNMQSASDRPYNQLRNINPSLLGFLSIPHGERNSWNFALFYSPLSELPFPIPGISYAWNPSDDFRMNIGLPLSVYWRPCERLSLEASYMVLRTVHTKISYELTDWANLYGGYDWSHQSWFLNDRVDDQERLFSYSQKLSAGIQVTLLECVLVDVSSGYVFDRFLFTGNRYDDNSHDRIDIDNGWFLSGSCGWKW